MRCGRLSTGRDATSPLHLQTGAPGHPGPACPARAGGLLRAACMSRGLLTRACACGGAQLCRQFEEAFAKSVDGGKGGGEQILTVFERRLTENIRQLEFRKILEPQNVKRIVEEADGYQPHLIAPEMGYRRLLQARAR